MPPLSTSSSTFLQTYLSRSLYAEWHRERNEASGTTLSESESCSNHLLAVDLEQGNGSLPPSIFLPQNDSVSVSTTRGRCQE